MNTGVVFCSQPVRLEFLNEYWCCFLFHNLNSLDRNFEWITGVIHNQSFWDRNLEKKEIPEYCCISHSVHPNFEIRICRRILLLILILCTLILKYESLVLNMVESPRNFTSNHSILENRNFWWNACWSVLSFSPNLYFWK